MQHHYTETVKEKQFQKPIIPYLLTSSERQGIFLQYCAFIALLFGAKLWLIGTYGNATPYWDQWDAEAELLYKPYLNGTLTWTNLLAAHNEHRIFTARLLAIALLYINQTWNPLLQMVVNAGLHVFLVVFGIRLLLKITGRNYLPAMLVFSLVLFSVPYAWENTLAGFQSPFYFVLMFSLATIWFTVVHEPLSPKWWGGVGCALLAFLSLASGVFALVAAAAINFFFFITGLRRTGRQLLSVAILSVLFVAGIWLTPGNESHASLKASSFYQFYDALMGVLGWPVMHNIVGTMVRNAPALVLAAIMIWKRPPANDTRWFLVALAVWSFGQALSIAYSRASISLSSRYLDLLAVLVLINFACLVVLVKSAIMRHRSQTVFALCAWVGIVLFTLGRYGGKHLPDALAQKQSMGLEEETNTRNYLATGDFNYLKDKPLQSIPYPNAERLAAILASPQLREILPANISHNVKLMAVVENPVGTFVKDGYYPTTPKRVDSTWGSYATKGNEAIGQTIIKYSSKTAGGMVEVPVAGYPLNERLKLEIEQGGQRSPMHISENPKESWVMAYAPLLDTEFSICLTDSSNTFWMAVAMPSVTSRLDQITDQLLNHYYLILLIGLVLVVFLLLQNGFKREESNRLPDV